MNITKVVNFVKLGYKIFEQWCIIEKKNNFHKMYILTVLLHKKNEMDTKSQTDEMSRHRHYRGELSFRRKKDLRCTAHTTISLSSRVMSMFKKKKKRVTIYNRGETNELERLQKVTWWLLPIFTHTHALTSRLHWPWFHKHIQYCSPQV